MANKKKHNGKNSPFLAFAFITGTALFTAFAVDKFIKPNNNQQQNQQYQVPQSTHANIVGSPIGPAKPQQVRAPNNNQQQQYYEPISENNNNEVQTLSARTQIRNNGPRFTGYPIQVNEQLQQQMPDPNTAQAPIVVPPKNQNHNGGVVGPNGYKGLISSHALEQIRDSNKPVVAASKIMTGPPSNKNNNQDDSGDYPYPTEILSPDAMMLNPE